MTRERKSLFSKRTPKGPARPPRRSGLRLRDAKSGELMIITVEDGEISVSPYRKEARRADK